MFKEEGDGKDAEEKYLRGGERERGNPLTSRERRGAMGDHRGDGLQGRGAGRMGGGSPALTATNRRFQYEKEEKYWKDRGREMGVGYQPNEEKRIVGREGKKKG